MRKDSDEMTRYKFNTRPHLPWFVGASVCVVGVRFSVQMIQIQMTDRQQSKKMTVRNYEPENRAPSTKRIVRANKRKKEKKSI